MQKHVDNAMASDLDSTQGSNSWASTISSSSRSVDPCQELKKRETSNCKLCLDDFTFIQKLGSGDIGSVYLAELKGSEGCMFAAKIMDKEELACRSKEGRAKTEREILEMLDHPFLPSLYATLDSSTWSCLLTEFCPGGDLHVLRQRQLGKRFDEAAVRFYVSEVVAALEYLHMLGIIYRDLKPENVLVKSDGHIMLTDFDLSLKCDDSTSPAAQLIYDDHKSQLNPRDESQDEQTMNSTRFSVSSCILPGCVKPRTFCFNPKPRRKRRWLPRHYHNHHGTSLKIVAEPIDAKSMSFVGTHEYLAPEIVSGEGHGNAVDWWTLGIFMYELLYGATPFRGLDNDSTLANIVARGLEFPKVPEVGPNAKDLISQLLVKDPTRRMGSTLGATAIKHHPFFDGVKWALLRCTKPPYIPQPFNYCDLASSNCSNHSDFISVDYY